MTQGERMLLMQEDTAGNVTVAEFEPGCTGPLRVTSYRKGEPPWTQEPPIVVPSEVTEPVCFTPMVGGAVVSAGDY